MRAKVVVTGVGAITPLGQCASASWKALLAGSSSIQNLFSLGDPEIDRLPIKVASWVDECGSDKTRLPKYIRYALEAAKEAILHAKLDLECMNRDRIVSFFLDMTGECREYRLEVEWHPWII